jgi:hypothetical protein
MPSAAAKLPGTIFGLVGEVTVLLTGTPNAAAKLPGCTEVAT